VQGMKEHQTQTTRARPGQEIDKPFLRWFEAKLGSPDTSEEDAINYLIALALPSWDAPRRECAAL
jgi:hypothetical protein